MTAVEERLVFGDESGTASLRPDPDFPVFVVAMCLVTARDYQQIVEPEFRALKQRHFGHDRVVLHERESRNGSGVFATLRGAAGRRAFYENTRDLDLRRGLRNRGCPPIQDHHRPRSRHSQAVLPKADHMAEAEQSDALAGLITAFLG